jgi:hypothetical protein
MISVRFTARFGCFDRCQMSDIFLCCLCVISRHMKGPLYIPPLYYSPRCPVSTSALLRSVPLLPSIFDSPLLRSPIIGPPALLCSIQNSLYLPSLPAYLPPSILLLSFPTYLLPPFYPFSFPASHFTYYYTTTESAGLTHIKQQQHYSL